MIAVTGGAGFIGSHLVERLLKDGKDVLVLDNLSTGSRGFIDKHHRNPNFSFREADLTEINNSMELFKGVDAVFHLAANPEVKLEDTNIHLNQNILATYNVLESMRFHGVKNIYFTSTSTIYGEAEIIPTPEDYGIMKPISIYGASKLACEALISAYCHRFEMQAVVFRLANVIGQRSYHGVIHDFMRKLERDPNEMEILGDGKQDKSYIHIGDCVDAMMTAIKNAEMPFDVFNIGSEDSVTTIDIAKIVSGEMGLRPSFKYTGGRRGWKGDVPVMRLDISKIRRLDWSPRLGSKDAVRRVVKDMLKM